MSRLQNQLAPEDADTFEGYVRDWQARLGLQDWRVVRSIKPARRSVMAEVVTLDLSARLASYRLGLDFGSTEVNAHSLEQAAVHELLHVLLHELIEAAKQWGETPDALFEGIEHRVINTLERLLVPPKAVPKTKRLASARRHRGRS